MSVRLPATENNRGGVSLEAVRAKAFQRRWDEVYEGLRLVDGQSALGSADMELLATASLLRARDREGRQALLRAHQLHLGNGDHRRAALCAVRIGLGQISTGEFAGATGCLPAAMTSCSAWVAQASALLDDGAVGVEEGYLLLPTAYERLAIRGDLTGASADAAQAVEVARSNDDPDLLVLGLTIKARALARSGSVEQGLVLLDEMVTTVSDRDVSPVVAGSVLGSAVDIAEEVFDVLRFGVWTEAFAAWCESQQGMVAFRSRSLAHLARLQQLRGRWDDAQATAEIAAAGSIAEADPTAAAVADYRRGELLRLRGKHADARSAYREAARRGLGPQPGLALLRLAEGDAESAARSLGRTVDQTTGQLKRAEMLPAWVESLVAMQDLAAAHEAVGQLEETARQYRMPALHGAAAHARGAVLLADGNLQAAQGSLRVALRVWLHLGLTHEEARVRVLIARCFRLLGDDDSARLELDVASRIFTGLGAQPDVREVGSLFATPRLSHGLTKRELDVLVLLAQGSTNKEIAEELTVALRTVDSHVSSIFSKLGVSTRSAATAFAHRHTLV